jgi:photosystem II stability/assembly factor-like uncharacterized protein
MGVGGGKMKKDSAIFTVLLWTTLIFSGVGFSQAAEWQEISRGNRDVSAILIDPQDPRRICMGAGNTLWESKDAGDNWRSILLIKGKNRQINFLAFGPKPKNCLYAATGEGLFSSNNSGKSWSRIFHGKNYLENDALSLIVLSDRLYLGTKGGLFIGESSGRNWKKASGELGSSQILAMAHDPIGGYLYLVWEAGVSRTADRGKTWEKIYIQHPQESSAEENNEADDDLRDKTQVEPKLKYISIDQKNNRLYLAGKNGLYRSCDNGKTWEALSSYGLLSQDANVIFVSAQSHLYLSGKSGIFEFQNERWHERSFGLVFREIRFLATDNQDNLYAACDSGLFKTQSGYFACNEENLNKPGIEQVQQAAMCYADVEPEKIIRWRKQAEKKAFLPKVNAGINRDTSDLWHWEGGSTTKIGDDVLIRGKETVGWDLTLTWDLGELIWNDAQTSIDVRSRLMVELRDDILDEVTKIYFERLRVKMELDNLS